MPENNSTPENITPLENMTTTEDTITLEDTIMLEDEITAEQIAQHYSAAMDSVNLINDLMAQESRNEEEQDTVDRNVDHLEIMVTKDFWTTEDLAPLNNAITAGS